MVDIEMVTGKGSYKELKKQLEWLLHFSQTYLKNKKKTKSTKSIVNYASTKFACV